MAEFKVGDRVQVSAPGKWGDGLIGDVIDADYCSVYPYQVDVIHEGEQKIWPARTGELTLIKPRAPKPKTIPARNLSGKHIGRVVTVTLRSGAEVKAELREVAHFDTDGPTTYVRLDGIGPQGMFDPFALDPDSKVTLS